MVSSLGSYPGDPDSLSGSSKFVVSVCKVRTSTLVFIFNRTHVLTVCLTDESKKVVC